MGRHCGDIALYSAIAGGAECVIVPEEKEDINKVCRKIIEGSNRGKLHSIVIKAEGTATPSNELVKEIESKTGKETKLVVLSYLQRGGSPTLNDRMLATLCGAKAVELMTENSSSKAIGMVDGHIVAYDLAEALEMPRVFDKRLYTLVDVLSK
jgi:6-phosphofructokinase 1